MSASQHNNSTIKNTFVSFTVFSLLLRISTNLLELIVLSLLETSVGSGSGPQRHSTPIDPHADNTSCAEVLSCSTSTKQKLSAVGFKIQGH